MPLRFGTEREMGRCGKDKVDKAQDLGCSQDGRKP
jgi:hypothetical protein